MRRPGYALAFGSAVYGLSNVVTAIVPFVLLPVVTRYLSPPEYGQVAMFQSLVAGLAAFTGLNTAGAASRRFYDTDATTDDIGSFVGACIRILAASTAFLLVPAFVFRDAVGGALGIPPYWVILAIVVSSAAFLVQLRLGQWQVRGNAARYAALQVAQGIAYLVLSLLAVVVLLDGARGLITAQTLVYAGAAAAALALLSRDGLYSRSRDPQHVREALAFGVPLVPHVAGMFLLTAADRIVIKAELGLAEAGVYMVAVQISLVLAIAFDAVNKAFVPWLFERLKRDRDDEKRHVVRVTYAYFMAALGAAAIAFLVGPFAVTLIAGDRYAAAGRIVGWLALGQAFGGMYLMVTNYIFFSRRTGLLSVASVGSGALNLILLILLTRAWGMVGAAAAFAISMFVRFALTWIIAQKRHPMPWLLARPAVHHSGT